MMKPKPKRPRKAREWWIHVDSQQRPLACRKKESATTLLSLYGGEVVRVREVLR